MKTRTLSPDSVKKQQVFENQLKNMELTFASRSGRQSRAPLDKYSEAFREPQDLKQNLTLQAIDQCVQVINEQCTVSKALEQNKFIFAKAMCKQKDMQDIISNFSNQISILIKKEFNKNQPKIQDFMKKTRAPDNSLNNARLFIDQIYETGDSRPSHTPHSIGRHQNQRHEEGETCHEQQHSRPVSKIKGVHGNNDPHANDLCDIPVDFTAPINFHDLAKKVKNASTIEAIARKYFILPDYEADPTLHIEQKWIKDTSETYDLLTFMHKKAALEDMKKRIDAEIERKKYLKKLGDNLEDINQHLINLDKQHFIVNIDENAERQKNAPQLNMYKMMLKVDPIRAQKCLQPQANNVVMQWGEDKVIDHSQTLNQWEDTWKSNQEFEDYIMQEEKWYQQEMKAMVKEHNIKMNSYKGTTLFYIEALEETINTLKSEKGLEIERLNMELQDLESQSLRNSAQQTEQGESFIESFITNTPVFGNVKEANRYVETLKDYVKTQFRAFQTMKQEYKSMKSDKEYVQFKLDKLEQEAKAKEVYLQIMNKVLEAGCNSAMPNAYLKPETLQAAKVYSSENLFQKHQAIIKDNGIESKVLEDISMSKMFAIIAQNMYDIVCEIGLMQLKPDIIKKEGTRKIKLNNELLTEMYFIFRTPLIQKFLGKAERFRGELTRFRKSLVQAAQKEEKPSSQEKKPEKKDQNDLIDERFSKLNNADKALPQGSLHCMLKESIMDSQSKQMMMQSKNSADFINQYNQLIKREFSSEVKEDDEQFKERLYRALDFKEGKFMIDPRKFVLLVHDINSQLTAGSGMDKYFEFYGRILSSVLGFNRLLSGKHEFSKSYLREINPFLKKNKESFTDQEVLKFTSQKLNLPEGMQPLTRQSSEQFLAVQKEVERLKAQVEQLKSRKEAGGGGGTKTKAVINSDIGGETQQLNEQKTNSSKEILPPGDAGIFDSFLKDILTIGKELISNLPSDDKKKKKKSNISETISNLNNIDVFNINIGKLDFDQINVKKNCKNKKFPPKLIEKLGVFEEHTIGQMVLTTLYDCIQLSFNSANATELSSKLSSKKFLILDESQKQSLRQSLMQLEVLDETQDAPERPENDEFNPQPSKDTLKVVSQNSKIQNPDEDQLQTPAVLNDEEISKSELKKKSSLNLTLDEIVERPKSGSNAKTPVSVRRALAKEESQKPKQKSIYLDDLYKQLEYENRLQNQAFEFFPPQKTINHQMYNTIKTNLDVIEKDAQKIERLREKRNTAYQPPKKESLLKKQNLQLDSDIQGYSKLSQAFTPSSSIKRPQSTAPRRKRQDFGLRIHAVRKRAVQNVFQAKQNTQKADKVKLIVSLRESQRQAFSNTVEKTNECDVSLTRVGLSQINQQATLKQQTEQTSCILDTIAADALRQGQGTGYKSDCLRNSSIQSNLSKGSTENRQQSKVSLIFKNASHPKFINQPSRDLDIITGVGNEMSPDDIEEQESMIINCQYEQSPKRENKFSTVANSNQHASQQDILHTQGSEKQEMITPKSSKVKVKEIVRSGDSTALQQKYFQPNFKNVTSINSQNSTQLNDFAKYVNSIEILSQNQIEKINNKAFMISNKKVNEMSCQTLNEVARKKKRAISTKQRPIIQSGSEERTNISNLFSSRRISMLNQRRKSPQEIRHQAKREEILKFFQ